MGNIIMSFTSGLGKAIGNLFGSPLDFFAGKSCSSMCGSTWDFICYIENFCVTNLLKMAMVLVLPYNALLLLYLLYNMGICGFVVHNLCKMMGSYLVCWFSLWEHICIFLSRKLIMLKRVGHHRRKHFIDMYSRDERHYIEKDDAMVSTTFRSRSHRMRHDYYMKLHLNKSLKPRSHHVGVKAFKRRGKNCGAFTNREHSIRMTHITVSAESR